MGFRTREACGVRGFTPAFRTRFMESGLGLAAVPSDHEPGRASLLASRITTDGTAARQEPRPTEPRFMESVLFLLDLLRGHEPESAGKPDALQTLRAERMGCRTREAFGLRGFTPAFPESGRARLLPGRVKVGSTAARPEPRPTEPRFMERGAADVAVRAPVHGKKKRGRTCVRPLVS